MKLRSLCSDSSSTEAVYEDGDVAMPSTFESSDEDYIANMVVEDSEDSVVKVHDEKGNKSDEDTGSSALKKRKVEIQNEKGCSSGKTEVHNMEDAVVHIPEVDKLVNDCIEYLKMNVSPNINVKRKKEDKPTLMWEVWEEEQERWINEHMAKEIDEDNLNEVFSETSDTPSDLVMPLLRYQKEWLAWGLKQEESVSRGGILADEMGMGKTVQAISLVLAKRELQKAIGEPYELSTSSGSSKALPAVKATLVICPLVAVTQWVGEIERFTTKGSNKILVYHGIKRGKTVQQFSEYDFVITTYSTVEAEYRKNLMPPKQTCQWCGKSFHERSMVTHLRHYCGPGAVRTFKQSKQRKKKNEILEKNDQKATVADVDGSESNGHKGKAGLKKNVELDKAGKKVDIGSVNHGPAGNSTDSLVDKSILHSVRWDRIILDEAHYIKDRRCNTTRAILTLESSYKWALSGTPLQNRVGELYSLVRFLQIVPYSYYFCKDCDCRTLDYSSSKDCPNCPHKAVRHFCWWNRNVATPIQQHGSGDSGRRAMFLLTKKLLKSIVLRRTKKGRAADLALPPRIVTLRKDILDIKEVDYYKSLYSESQSQFNTYIEAGTLMNNYAHIFDLLTRLRQAVDHPYLVVYSNSAANRSYTVADNIASVGGEHICGICHDPAEDAVVTSCAHIFCKSCLIDFSVSIGHISCPSCLKPLTVDLSTNTNTDSSAQGTKTTVKGFRSSSILNRIRLNDFQTSTKIDALREEIRFMIERDGSAKGIVFSQFTSFLDLIHYSLQKSGINCVQLVGSMTMNARDAAITRFTNDPDCRIFLMSLRAGGVALNLTVASHVFLMDPWWNPAVERQAQDRIHRIGQYKPIRIVRFVIEDTIEERILKLQEKKELVFEGTVGGSSEALGKLTEADLKFLFVT